MVTVLGHRGYLGAVVERRWSEIGAVGEYVVVCLTPDNVPLIRRLAGGPGVIVPSTDAIAEDTEYAATKREIEGIPGIVVIRAGIVDTRKANTYANVHVNPLTPLEWADLAWELRDRPGIHVAGREAVTRFDVGWAIADVAGTTSPDPEFGPRDLSRIQPADRDRPPLRRALAAYREWLG